MSKTTIEWTQHTWNPTTGCDKVSQGCKFCYAEVMSRRLAAMGVEKYKNGFDIEIHETALLLPYTWKKPRIVFVNSMSDLFHDGVSDDFIHRTFKVMNDNPQHTFQVLTKRAERLLSMSSDLSWTPNIWMGVSVENRLVIDRIDLLTRTGAAVKFLSCEPLLGPLPSLDLQGINWVIVGGESGRKPRPIKEEWVMDIMRQCQVLNTPFFFKQWGGTNKKKSGRILNGTTYSEMPYCFNPYKPTAF